MAPEKTTEKLVYIYKIKCFQIDLCLHDLSGKIYINLLHYGMVYIGGDFLFVKRRK